MQQYHHQYTSQCYFRWDHPREYGENGEIKSWRFCFLGPSPRIRGKYGFPGVADLLLGTIPANTGKILRHQCRTQGLQDHPREYGENMAFQASPISFLGPSPRIRGECNRDPIIHQANGTIPANTGRIHCGIHQGAPTGDHPREYGENRVVQPWGDSMGGPSPRIRGEFPGSQYSAVSMGTIPANTGRMFSHLR